MKKYFFILLFLSNFPSLLLGLENTKPSNESITLPAPIQIINDEELLADDIESENSEVPWLCHVPGLSLIHI